MKRRGFLKGLFATAAAAPAVIAAATAAPNPSQAGILAEGLARADYVPDTNSTANPILTIDEVERKLMAWMRECWPDEKLAAESTDGPTA